MLEVLTPLTKVERVTRSIDPSNFVAVPGIWAALDSEGVLTNVVTGTESGLRKLVISSSSASAYESHDVEVGRITTMESFGVRVKVDTEGYVHQVDQGDFLVVCAEDGYEGKLVAVSQAAAGTYFRVAMVEEVDATNGTITYRTITPSAVTSTGEESSSSSSS